MAIRENQAIMSTTFVPPLDWPHYGIGFLPAVKRAFQKYATFSGRASRSEFWWWVLANAIVGTVLYAADVRARPRIPPASPAR